MTLVSASLRAPVAVAPAGASRRRRLSLEMKSAAFTCGALLIVSVTIFFQLAARERERLILTKTTAASMVTQLLAHEIAPAIEFGEEDYISVQFEHLRSNPDIVAATVFASGASAPTASWSAGDVAGVTRAPPLAAPSADEPDGTVVSAERLVTTRTIANRAGDNIARIRVAFTLRPENETFRASRLRLLWTTAAAALAIAGLLAFVARRYVLRPLAKLADAAGAMATGDMSARVEYRSDDEIGDLARAFNVMSEAVSFRQERLRKEIDLAHRIQTAILPKSIDTPGLELIATMIAATEVGGDYYDVIPFSGGCWIGIGDVAGHGLDTGLIMLMTQATVSALVRRETDASPSSVVCVLNEVLFDNIHNRLEREDHVTFTLFRCDRSGHVVFAGAHEDVIVYRADARHCDTIETSGTWLGGRHDIRHATIDSSLQLNEGDVLVLYTDGVTELRNGAGEEFGLDRLCSAIERMHGEPVDVMQLRLREALAAWGVAGDDMTLLIARYRAIGAT